MPSTSKKTQPSAVTAKKSAVALKAFFAIAAQWGLSKEQQSVILGIPESTLYRYASTKKDTSPLRADTLERISYILGIYKALRILLPDAKRANEWIHKPNLAPLFGGHTALEKLLIGRVIDLADVRRYLDAERG